MKLDIEYGIRTDIRNNPVVREVDASQRHELRRSVLLAALSVGLVLFSAWQSGRFINTSMRIESLRVERAEERIANRTLRASVEALESAERVELLAAELGMRPATLADTVFLERIVDPIPADGILALAR
jgi:hypothetical protein